MSTMQYIAKAEELAAMALRFANRMPKRYAFRMANPLVEHAEEAVYHCLAANITYVRADDGGESFGRRRAHLTEAQGHLVHVESLLGIYHANTVELARRGECRPPNDNAYCAFGELLDEVHALIKGVKASDTRAYNKALKQEAGERPEAPPTTGGSVPSTARRTSATSTPTAR